MAGSLCQNCKELTFYKTSRGGECSKCGYTMTAPSKNKGKGQKCNNCKAYTVKGNKCESCGATYEVKKR